MPWLPRSRRDWRLFLIATGSLIDWRGDVTRRALRRELGVPRYRTVAEAFAADRAKLAGDWDRAAAKAGVPDYPNPWRP